MKPQRLDKMGDDRWSAQEETVSVRFFVLVVCFVLLAYGIAGAIE